MEASVIYFHLLLKQYCFISCPASNYRLFIKVCMGRIQYRAFHFSFSPFSKADEHQGRELINTPPWHSSHKINTSPSQLANATQAFPSNTLYALNNVLLMTLQRCRNAITLQPYDFLTLDMFIRRGKSCFEPIK